MLADTRVWSAAAGGVWIGTVLLDEMDQPLLGGHAYCRSLTLHGLGFLIGNVNRPTGHG